MSLADTPYGQVEGERVNSVLAFLGIPYAEQPVGPLRFLPPQPAEPWTGVRPALSLGPAAPQPPTRPREGWGFDLPPTGEACLTLNVWTPGTPGRRPVLVWIHGGGYSTGSSGLPIYDGAALAARHDVVVVGVGHRLGLLGFLELEDLPGSGNASLLDLVAALEWVRDSIPALGGDPSRVLVFGESGGGGKVLALLAMPAAAGLFGAAAVQSGAYFKGPGGFGRELDHARAVTEQVVARAGGADRLRLLSTDELVEIQRELEAQRTRGTTETFAFGPLVDGLVLPDHPLACIEAGASSDVPLVIGSTTDEPTTFGFEAFDEWVASDEALGARIATFAPAGTDLVGTYRRLRPEASRGELLTAIVADQFRIGALQLAEARCAAGGAPTFVYLFGWQSPLEGIGAGHTVELPLLFHTIERSVLTRGGKGAEAVAAALSSAWVNLAATGSPSTAELPWSPYDVESRPTMVFDVVSRVEDDPLAGEREAWTQLSGSVSGP
jgi:para-nitrobenzyl esterase